MVKRAAPFRARDLFSCFDEHCESSRQIIGLVRPHPEDDHIIQVAHPSSPEEWHYVHEDSVIGFTPLRTPSAAGDAKLARLFLHDEDRHRLSETVQKLLDGSDDAGRRFSQSNAQSVLAGGAQYCYYDAQGKYICIPI